VIRGIIQKTNHHRDRKLLNTAKGQDCTLRLDTGLGCPSETVVWAHSDESQHGKGSRIKSHDCFGAWACANCHVALPNYKRDERVELFYQAMIATRKILINDDIINCKLTDYRKLLSDDDYWLDCWQTGKLRVK